ncbi:MAG: PASTA domain-containing protein [Flavobacteriaceae bacterium]|nr:PASTA domain-containing protein [Flavobacteriaceae bacterium]
MQLLKYLKSKQFIRSIIIMILSLVIAIFLLTKFLSFKTHHDQRITVPDLAKLSLDEADVLLKEADLKFIVIDSARFNPDYPPRSVIEQNPEAGDFVKEGRKIYLTLNASNYRKVAIPDLLGKTKRQVVTHLTSIGFRIGTFTYVPDIGRDVVRKLKFKGKELKSGEMVAKNSEIDLVLGDGKLGNTSDLDEDEN